MSLLRRLCLTLTLSLGLLALVLFALHPARSRAGEPPPYLQSFSPLLPRLGGEGGQGGMRGITPAQSPGPGAVVINEVAWGGTAANAAHEWIELYNTTGSAIDLTGWRSISSDDADRVSP
jgi:hypothetical protein